MTDRHQEVASRSEQTVFGRSSGYATWSPLPGLIHPVTRGGKVPPDQRFHWSTPPGTRTRNTRIKSSRRGKPPRFAAVRIRRLTRYFVSESVRQRSVSVEPIATVLATPGRLGSQWTPNKSAVETLDTYGHVWPDDEDLTRQAVDSPGTLRQAIASDASRRRGVTSLTSL
jgi:hypothetical protein